MLPEIVKGTTHSFSVMNTLNSEANQKGRCSKAFVKVRVKCYGIIGSELKMSLQATLYRARPAAFVAAL